MTQQPIADITGARLRAVDTHFTVFHELMTRKVSEILLVTNAYDAYILEEDGSLASKIINEYHGLNLSRPPRLTHAASAAEALELLEQKGFDMVIAMPNLPDMEPFALGREIKRRKPELPVMLLAHGIEGLTPKAGQASAAGIDRTFVWSGDSDLLLALVKNAEDRMNVTADTRSANVRVLLLVEDSPLYRSFFLPLIYKLVVKQTQAVLEESLNEEHRLLKMRARPKILLAETYEQAMKMYTAHKPYVFGVISDTRFPKAGTLDAEAGLEFLARIKEEIPHLPLLLMSNETENRGKAESAGLWFMDKNSPELAEELRSFFTQFLGFGDFVFHSPDGEEIGRASNFRELEELLPSIPDEPIFYEASRNRFSNWFMARSEITLASILNRISVNDFATMTALRAFLIKSIHVLRQTRQKGVVVQFSPRTFDPRVSDFTKIGQGSLGGKARGMAFFANLLHRDSSIEDRYPEIEITIPRTLVITTDIFDAFMDQHALKNGNWRSMDDPGIAKKFLEAPLPGSLARDLEVFLSHVTVPLSVRSSSLLEDAHFHPFSGLYKTYMIPNNHPSLAERRDHLLTAIRLVYASAFFRGPRIFERSTAGTVRRDAMAVMIQELIGSAHGDFFYPAISGVAQSWNYYPVAPMTPGVGIARIALGMGKTVVEGKSALRFSPLHPTVLPQFSRVEDILENAQNRFYALRIRNYDAGRVFAPGANLELRDVTDAAEEMPVKRLASTYSPAENRIRDSATGHGTKIMTFASVLKYNQFPLPALLSDLLILGREGMGCAVEFEFSVDFASHPDRRDIFAVLQMRPMAAGEEHADVRIGAEDRKAAICFSSNCLGNGVKSDIADIVYVRPDRFDPARTVAVAEEIGRMNARLKSENRPFLLIGPGRWGSADRWLGIPVRWADISGVATMVELRNESLNADASHGTHFFQHITAHGIFYLTVTEGNGDFIHWDWLGSRAAAAETTYLRHIRLSLPLRITADGQHGIGAAVPGKD